ncbi:hypothetical protein COW98_04175 [Candidatus Roizmanbacteria bacterium CG22_combo_CG10-13_8_21_14_all_35_9]|uniref:Uncharacterized protein n=4 Tax=Candidatus Roizmaniibacteriota TaxID=1752723 RepID=A0A2M8F525_9BACT|nr:MAG: hypothetical protein COX47_03715 [Candidatus Roizmanbacteria bacterium CG23_combo_of_CG06-09_8_20_14_all_35_49]PIP62406.1 MAG: hypothetical protein COW98_04175 [Candidatus Roizmanbacteria bacterium CG22_combo_CG10-13_8_21_14_all_35_9]PIY71374.1 MAG: hypothetical protein COY88_00595 [Candidatus Roizmanbacteria bacterium CG_4_10_14_0_8_um_filter_35_28]PJC34404.1 MAG: hypothetical protein CO048_00070 [Candidatus Roizmanbacteria bacterium CG_4_9_14_0_2_um_filter_35_15]PJC82552.1 MAG: hypoth
MEKKETKDVMEVLSNLRDIIDHKPSTLKMYEEIQMMKFKIRPLQGDVLAINLNNERFLETLWSLGKLDEFFQREYGKMSKKDQEIFIRYFDNFYKNLQQELNKIKLYNKKNPPRTSILEMEIFKEKLLKKKVN